MIPNPGKATIKIWSVNREIFSVNRETSQEKHFTSKIMQKMRQGDQFQTSFCFLKKI